MGGDPNPKGGIVVRATIASVTGQHVTFRLDKEKDAEYFKEEIGDAVILSVSDAPGGD
jgi:hypothetical protein